MKATGQTAELRVGYQVAAWLAHWKLEVHQSGSTFVAEVVQEHDLWINHEPFDLVLKVGNDEWIWREVRPVIEADQKICKAKLYGRPEIDSRRSMVATG